MAPAERHRSSLGTGKGAPSTTTEDQQYNASNKTLSKFLGGRRQPSWMDTALPVKPTPRSSNRPPRESLPELPAVRGRLPSVEVPQQLQSHQQRRESSTIAAQANQATPVVAAANVCHQLPPQSPLPPSTLTQTTTLPAAASAILPSPAPSDESSPAVPASADVTSPTRSQTLAAKHLYSAPATISRFELPDAGNATAAKNTNAKELMSQSNTTSANGTTTAAEKHEAVSVSAGASSPTAAAITLQTPPTPSASYSGPMTAALPPSPDGNGNREHPAKRRRIGNMSLDLLVNLKAFNILRAHIQQSGGEEQLNYELERPRFQLLQNACATGDLFFVVLHQLFCSWSYDNSIAQNKDPNLIDNAFGLMGTILKSNSKLNAEHAEFFRNFPHSLEVLRAQVPLYAHTISRIFVFLTNLSQAWMIVNHDHRRMGYPLIMDELLSTFGLFSATLQTILFRASRRTLGVNDGPIGETMDALFRHDQTAHLDSYGNFTARVTENFYNEPQNGVLIRQFAALVAQARRLRQNHQQQSVPVTNPDQQVFYQQQHRTDSINQQTQPPNDIPNATRYDPGSTIAPVLPNNRQPAQPPGGIQYTTGSPTGNNLAFAQYATTQAYALPSTQHTIVQSNTSMASPTTVQFRGQPPLVQSPMLAQGQYSQAPGCSDQFAGVAQPSPTAMYSHPQNTHTRRASQHLQINSQSPKTQTLVGLPQQRNSPVQNNIAQMQQARIPGRSTPYLQTNASQASSQLRQATIPGVIANLQNIGNNISYSQDLLVENRVVPQAYPNLQQQQQYIVGQRILNHTNTVQQSNMRPEAWNARPAYQARPSGSMVVDHRRTVAAQIPTTQYPHDPYERKSLEMSLHQTHLRSPRRLLKGIGVSSPPERYYQFVKYLALQPTPIPQQKFLHICTFKIPEEECDRISRDSSIGELSPRTNLYFNGSLRVRLRVCLDRKAVHSMSEEEWILADSYWPEHIHMQLNQHTVEIKRKQHHAKDQPIEIGELIKPGENVLKVSVPVHKTLDNNALPFVAVEVVETLSHSSLQTLSQRSAAYIPVQQTRAIIQQRLAGSANIDGDEIAVVTSDLTINLADPFSYALWKTPARGKDCTHLECFDLETWLETRPSKRSCTCGAKKASDCRFCPKEPSVVDKWKCPLCQGDARPYSLRIDGFLLEIRNTLAARGLLNVKEVQVAANGTWNAIIPNDDSDFDSDEDTNPSGKGRAPSTGRPATTSTASQTPQQNRAQIEVICLDD